MVGSGENPLPSPILRAVSSHGGKGQKARWGLFDSQGANLIDEDFTEIKLMNHQDSN